MLMRGLLNRGLAPIRFRSGVAVNLFSVRQAKLDASFRVKVPDGEAEDRPHKV